MREDKIRQDGGRDRGRSLEAGEGNLGEFRTIKGYDQQEHKALTPTMEDYLEMICRSCGPGGFVRVGQLSQRLNVRPSSTTKIAEQLKKEGYVEYERYGVIYPTEKGWEAGSYLLYRHEVLHQFFCLLNGTADELEQVERVEHYLNRQTVENLEKWLERERHCISQGKQL